MLFMFILFFLFMCYLYVWEKELNIMVPRFQSPGRAGDCCCKGCSVCHGYAGVNCAGGGVRGEESRKRTVAPPCEKNNNNNNKVT